MTITVFFAIPTNCNFFPSLSSISFGNLILLTSPRNSSPLVQFLKSNSGLDGPNINVTYYFVQFKISEFV